MSFPLIESIIWTIVFLLFVVIFFLVIYLKILRRDFRVVERRAVKYTNKVEELLIEFLYAEEEGVEISSAQKNIIKKFKSGLSSKKKRKIITATFFKLSQEVSGNMIYSMHKLYDKIGLLNYAIRKLRSKKWNIIALGIRDLREFKVKQVEHLVSKYINHSREEVRREAHLYFIELFKFQGLNFLDTLKKPLSEWDQIQLMGEIKKFDDKQIMDVSKWLYSENDYVILFVLNLVKQFNLLENKEILLQLLEHSNIQVRLNAMEILAHFQVVEAKEALKPKVDELSQNEKIAFFNILDRTATMDDNLFILNYITNTDFDIQYKALAILKRIDKNLYEKLEKKSEDESYNKIIRFLDYNYGL